MIQPIDSLSQFSRCEMQRRLDRRCDVALEAMQERPLRRKLPVQPHRDPPHPGKRLLLVARVSDQHPLLDSIEVVGEAVGIALDGFDHVLDDRLEQLGDCSDLAAAAQRPAGRLKRVQAVAAAADEELLRHGEMQEADFIDRAAKSADEIGEDSIDASRMGM